MRIFIDDEDGVTIMSFTIEKLNDGEITDCFDCHISDSGYNENDPEGLIIIQQGIKEETNG